MDTHNTAGRGLAIAAGVIFATGTLGILFSDVISQAAPFTLKHYLTLVIVAGTMMAGHLADQARRHRHWASMIGFSLVFLAGTGLVVYNSVGRQAEKSMMTTAEHDDVVQKRNDLKTKLTGENAALLEKRAIADKKCAKDKDGDPCRNARAVEAVYADTVAGTEARIDRLSPPKPVAPEAEEFATVAAALGYDKEQIKALAVLLSPFFQTLFLEFGTIVSFGFAFSPKRQPKLVCPAVAISDRWAQSDFPSVREAELGNVRALLLAPKGPDSPGAGARTVRLKSVDGPRPGGPQAERRTKTETLQYVLTELALGRTFPSQDTLVRVSDRPKQTVSDWCRDWERQRLIPARIQRGRCKVLASN